MYRPLGKLSAHRHPYYRQLGKLSGRVINRAAVKHGLSNKWLGTCSHIPQGRCARRTSLGDLVMVTYTHLTVTDLPGTEGHICHWRDAFLFVVRSKTHVYTVGKSQSHRQKNSRQLFRPPAQMQSSQQFQSRPPTGVHKLFPLST